MAAVAISGWSLGSLLAGIAMVPADADRVILGLSIDSRRIAAGDCFLALGGARDHGARHAREAVAAGAVAVLTEQAALALAAGVPVIVVPELRARAGMIAARFYGAPAAALRTVGVTGTNGKTTVAHGLAQALDAIGRACAYVGTLGIGRVGALRASPNTTPNPVDLQHELAGFRAAGCAAVALEVSSHALVQGRIAGLELEVAVFTNLGHDHLDYHGTMAAYAATKRALFRVPGLRAAVVNVDDPVGRAIAADLHPAIECWALGSAAACARVTRAQRVVAHAIRADAHGCVIDFATPRGSGALHTPLIGAFNGANMLAVVTVLLALGTPFDDALAGVRAVRPIPGRMECYGGGAGMPTVVVDYAHTPESLECALGALRALGPRALHCVFGCGGERDRSKRPVMGAVAARLADTVVITSDNPRGEDARTIANEIAAGTSAARQVVMIADRALAIRQAIAAAAAADIVLVAGKGHETTQEIDGQRLPFQDQAVVQAALAERAR